MKKEREETVHKASIDQYLNSIFDKLPSNAIINKGRCGIGGTRLEIETPRDSIIVVPLKSIIECKCKNMDGEVDSMYKTNPKIFGIMGKPKKAKLVSIFEDKHPVKKIFTTPSGLRKLMECGYSKELIKQNWFLLLDECHTAITDSFRNDILIPFDYFWDFPKENRAMISATPYEFSDLRFLEMDTHTIKIKGKLGTVEYIDAKSIPNCLHYILNNPNQFKGNIHIFFNSVIEIAKTLRTAQLDNYSYSIYVADNEPNMNKLDEFKMGFVEQPKLENFCKINFYSSRYFEGWDMLDVNPTILLVTDVNVNTTKLGIRNKAFQAMGRARNPIDRIIHLTNHRNTKELLSFEEIQRQNVEKAKSVIEIYNNHIEDSMENNFNSDKHIKEACEKYAILNDNTACYDSNLIDQLINQEYCDQDYNHIDYIKEAWIEMNYNIEEKLLDAPEIPEDYKRLSKTNKMRFIVKVLERMEQDKRSFLFDRYTIIKNSFPSDAIEWIDAYYTLGKAAFEEVEYSPNGIRKLLIEDYNLKMEPKKIKMVKAAFVQGVYTSEEVNSKLYTINQSLGVKDSKGNYKSGKKDELNKYFKIRPDKSQTDKSQYEAEFGKYTFQIEGKNIRKLGFKVY